MTARIPAALPRPRSWIGILLPLAVAALAVVAAGCGHSSEPDLVQGKTLFIGKGTCGSCHSLAHAGTKGTTGPDLDDAFANARAAGMTDNTIKGVVRDQISHARRGSLMPRNLVKGQDAIDVAAYVGAVAAKPGKDIGALANVGGGGGNGPPAVAKAGLLSIPADPSGALSFVTRKASAPPGKVTIQMPNKAPIQHDIGIKGPVTGQGPVVGTGGTSKFTVTLKPGSYTFFCSVPGHEAGGMKGTLTVK
jgi:plastocyanin/mono/diheme cytochrome c family protein